MQTWATVSLSHLVPFVSLPISPDEFDAYIIVSFVNATLVLSIGETVEEVTDSGFLGTTPTLSCSLLGEDALVQVKGFVGVALEHLIEMTSLHEFNSIISSLAHFVGLCPCCVHRCIQMGSATSEQTSV